MQTRNKKMSADDEREYENSGERGNTLDTAEYVAFCMLFEGEATAGKPQAKLIRESIGSYGLA